MRAGIPKSPTLRKRSGKHKQMKQNEVGPSLPAAAPPPAHLQVDAAKYDTDASDDGNANDVVLCSILARETLVRNLFEKQGRQSKTSAHTQGGHKRSRYTSGSVFVPTARGRECRSCRDISANAGEIAGVSLSMRSRIAVDDDMVVKVEVE